MTKRQEERRNRLLPNGFPRKIRVYDNGGTEKEGGTIDRYTVVFTGNYGKLTGGETWVLAMNGSPFYPQGFCQHCPMRERPDYPRYGHLGKKIRFVDLPSDCQIATLEDYLYLWGLVEGDDGSKSHRVAREMVESRIQRMEAVPV